MRGGPRTRRARAIGAAAVSVLWLAACGASVASADEDPGAADVEEGSQIQDPWEPMNRAIFAFNEKLDIWLLEPVARAWDWALPDFVLRGIDNVVENGRTPGRLLNDLLQGKPEKFGDDLGRFLVNTTFGLGGLFDPAGASGLPAGDEDFGQTLGVWGVPPGPYLVLPFLGPYNPRDTLGYAVDSVTFEPERWFIPFYVNLGISSTNVVNGRALLLEEIAAERRAAFDFYAAVRNAAVTFRANQVRDRVASVEDQDEEDLYYLDDE